MDIQPIEAGVAKPEAYGLKPLLVLDIDGVINRIPFREIYVGPNCDCEQPSHWPYRCKHLLDPSNWEVQRTELSELLFDDVPATIDEGVELGHVNRGTGELESVSVWVSEELADSIRGLYNSGAVDIVYMSLWRENSQFLNGFLGLPIPHIRITQKFTESEQSAKRNSLVKFLREVARANSGVLPPLGWADDVATAPEYGKPIESILGKMLKGNGLQLPAAHIIHTEITEGLTRKNWADLVEFFEAHGRKSS